MTEESGPSAPYRAIAAFVRSFPYVHQGVGLFGNTLFVVGSVLFLLQQQGVGVWFFLTGSIGMFVGSLGDVIRTQGRRTLWKHDIDPQVPTRRWSEEG